jgi:hypothetical protein
VEGVCAVLAWVFSNLEEFLETWELNSTLYQVS